MAIHAVGLAAQLTSVDSAPWWGVPVVAGVFLLAVVVLTFVANLILKRLELARGDRSKWDQEVLELAIEIKRLCSEMAAVGTKGNAAYEEDITRRIPIYATQIGALQPPVEKLGLIASKKLSKKATQLLIAAMSQGIEHNPSYMSDAELKEEAKKLSKVPTLSAASKEFKEAVRKELRARR